MTPNDRLAAVMLAILLAIGATIVVSVLNDPQAFEHAETHPQFASMQVGGAAAERDEDLWWVGWLVGSLMFTFAGSMILLCVNQIENSRGLRIVCHITILLLIAAYTYGCFAYRDFGITHQPLVKSVAPLATKILLLGVWVVPMLYTFIYVLAFDRWFWTSTSNPEREQ